MILCDVAAKLPDSFESPQALRIQRFLQHVRLLHPMDLIITKLERAADQDLEDSLLLRGRYPSDIEVVRQRTLEAARYHVISDRARGQIEYAFEGIFEELLDLNTLT